jgi:hypothetical protein
VCVCVGGCRVELGRSGRVLLVCKAGWQKPACYVMKGGCSGCLALTAETFGWLANIGNWVLKLCEHEAGVVASSRGGASGVVRVGWWY